MNYKVLYNPLSGCAGDASFLDELRTATDGAKLELYDVTKTDLVEFFKTLPSDDGVILSGGDGTINHFINRTQGLTLPENVYYYAAGSGNDFWTDIGRKKGDKPVKLAQYIKNLPSVTVKGKTYKFINGVGYGIDGYCCEVGDKMKAEGKQKINYASIAIKGLLFHFKSRNAEVTVDGKTEKFDHVWIAPTMNGRFYGGGMMPTPAQDRLNAERTVSVCVFHGKSKLGTLMIFPSLFKGEHIKKEKHVKIFSGKTVTVKFDTPCALQIDGETILDVTEYTVNA